MSGSGDFEIEQRGARTLCMRLGGRLGPQEFDAIVRETERVADELGQDRPVVDMVSVVEGELRIDPEVRGAFVSFARRRLVRRCAVVGGPRRSRVLVEMLINAIHIVAPDTAETKFCATEAEALAWLEAP